MAPNATIYKIELQLSDMDRHYYATHALTLARHPSETDERMMVRLLAFALYADERLEFGKGLSTDEEPDLWRKELNGDIALWIDLGQPDPARIRKACGRARKVIVVNYGGRSADIWWEKSAEPLQRLEEPRRDRHRQRIGRRAGRAGGTRVARAMPDPGRPRADPRPPIR